MPKRITIENAELSIVFGENAYSFDWVTSVVINDPRENVLANSPQGRGDGIVYRNGTTTPVATEMVVREVPGELYSLMKDAFENQDRVDIMLYDKVAGDQYTLDDSVIRTNPSNLNLSEGEDSFDVPLNVSTTTNRFTHTPTVEAVV